MDGRSATRYPEVLEYFFGFVFAVRLYQHFPQRAFLDPFLIFFCHFLPFFCGWTHPFTYDVYSFLINPGRTLRRIRLRAFQTALFVFLSAAAGTGGISAYSLMHRFLFIASFVVGLFSGSANSFAHSSIFLSGAYGFLFI
jgi:hypothetical protein